MKKFTILFLLSAPVAAVLRWFRLRSTTGIEVETTGIEAETTCSEAEITGIDVEASLL